MLQDGSDVGPVEERTSTDQRNYNPAWSPDGRLIAAGGEVLLEDDWLGAFYWSDMDLHVVGPDGRGFRRLATPHQHASAAPAWSPDGSRIAYMSDEGGHWAIHTVKPDGSDVRRIIGGAIGADAMHPEWSPDGSRILFLGHFDPEASTPTLYTMRPDGSDVHPVAGVPGWAGNPTWSPDGSRIAFSAGSDGQSNVYVVSAAGGPPTQLTHGGSDGYPAWSPDGKLLVFASNRDAEPGTSRQDLYLVDADGTNERRLTTIGCWQCSPDWQREPVSTWPPSPAPRRDWPGPPGPERLRGPVRLSDFAISRSSFRWRFAKRIRLVVRLDAPGDVRFVISRLGTRGRATAPASRQVTRYLPSGTQELQIGRLFRRPLKPGRYRLVADTGRQGSTVALGFRVLRRR